MHVLRLHHHLLLAALLAVSGFTVAQESQALGRKDCQLQSRPQWQDRTLQWEGPCKAGKAEGAGVLKAYSKGKASPEIFYGQVVAGALHFGVLEIEGGFQAGKFVHGAVQDDEDRNVLIKAFDVASAAAQAYSERLQKTGNASSAKFYATKAKRLAEQMD
ncbi:hypothetical protein V8J88_09720 [Massilia sp. W12]|uniref:hypothetical protein n=1 Tax=Massilia sp. W12 TaxID=3126507 RepID=UPI0030D46360